MVKLEINNETFELNENDFIDDVNYAGVPCFSVTGKNIPNIPKNTIVKINNKKAIYLNQVRFGELVTVYLKKL